MSRKVAIPMLFLALFTIACGSMNRVTPAGADKVAMEADIRGKIAEAVPSKTFAVEVNVGDNGVVTLTGHADNADDVRKIGDAAGSVSGVTRVINNVHVKGM